MPRKTDARDKALQTAVRLFERQGYHGTGLAQILAESGCPRGSFYHHFPGGKEQLGLEAIGLADAEMREVLTRAARRARSPRSYLRALTKDLSARLERSGYAGGDLLSGFTVETAALSPRLREACAGCYRNWQELIGQHLAALGMSAGRSTAVASTLLSALGGAALICRAEGSPRALEDLRRSLGDWLG